MLATHCNTEATEASPLLGANRRTLCSRSAHILSLLLLLAVVCVQWLALEEKSQTLHTSALLRTGVVKGARFVYVSFHGGAAFDDIRNIYKYDVSRNSFIGPVLQPDQAVSHQLNNLRMMTAVGDSLYFSNARYTSSRLMVRTYARNIEIRVAVSSSSVVIG